MLTAAQQDYIEAIFLLQHERNWQPIRVTDIAAQLGTRLPTVTRTVDKLTRLGLLSHEVRGDVALTTEGRKMAEAVVHRHKDLVDFFTGILGLSNSVAETDSCQIEHGLSAQTAQRLHEFLDYVDQLPEKEKRIIRRFASSAAGTARPFKNLPISKTTGWRG